MKKTIAGMLIWTIVIVAANFSPYFTSGGGTPSNAVVFPATSPPAYIQSSGGQLKLFPPSAGTVDATSYLGVGAQFTAANVIHTQGDAGNFSTTANTTISIQDTDAGAGGGAGGRLGRFINRRNTEYVAQNMSPASSTTWNLDQTGSGGAALQITNTGQLFFFNVTSGANPRTPTTQFTIDVTATPLVLANGDIGVPSGSGFMINATAASGHFLLGNGSRYIDGTFGTGLTATSSTVTSNAIHFITFQPGIILSISNGKVGFYKVGNASTVDNITGSCLTFTCSVNPVVTFFECGTSTTCASPTTIGTVTITAASTAFVGTVSSSAITAGDYVAWAITTGTCSSFEPIVTSQVHSN